MDSSLLSLDRLDERDRTALNGINVTDLRDSVRKGDALLGWANAHLPQPDPQPSDLLLKKPLIDAYACHARYTEQAATITRADICWIFISALPYNPIRMAVPTLYTINVTIHARPVMYPS